MADWQSDWHLEDTFFDHGREMSFRTAWEDDESAQETLRVGTSFTFTHEGRFREGCYDVVTRCFVVLNDHGALVNHFFADEWYVAGLDDSTYDG